MLTDLKEDGTARWTCHKCGSENQAHVSHEHMEWTPRPHIDAVKARFVFNGVEETEAERLAQAALGGQSDTIKTPPCPCGAGGWFLKVNFTPEELRAPNMLDEQGNPTPSHAAAHRHMALVEHMKAAGKGKPQ